jgi:hypothetical protein
VPRPGHNLTAPNKPNAVADNSPIYRLLTSGEEVSQSVANQLLGFNIQRFRLAAVGYSTCALDESVHGMSHPNVKS